MKTKKESAKNLHAAQNEAEETRNKFVTLSERHKHDTKKHYEITVDWRDYNKNLEEWLDGWELMKLTEGFVIDFDKLTTINIRSQEIIKRYDKLLSNKS